MKIPYLDYLKTIPDFGPKLVEALQSISRGSSNTEQQGNLNPAGQPAAPPSVNSVTVTGQNGHFDVKIVDNSQIYRGVKYFVDHADNPQFTNARTEALGPSRNGSFFLGNATRYWRAYSAYESSPPSKPVYHGSSVQPIAVFGGGNIGPPAFQSSEGSGTGPSMVTGEGPGKIPFRSTTGVPPSR